MGRILREARIKKCEVLLRTCCMLLHAQTQQIWLQACKGFLCTSPYTSQQAKVRIQDIWLVGIILKGDSRMSSSSRCPVRTNDPINHPDCALQRRDRSEAFKALPTGIFIWMLRKTSAPCSSVRKQLNKSQCLNVAYVIRTLAALNASPCFYEAFRLTTRG